MKRIKIVMTHLVQRFFLLFICFVVANLSFPHGVEACDTFADYIGGEVRDLTDSDHGMNTPLFNDGTIYAYQGFGCAESNKSNFQGIIKVKQSLAIPSYATKATVLLNGWYLKYLHSPHKIAGLGTWIYNITPIERGTLSWEVAGVLSDWNNKEPYNWCYHYTVLAWNPTNINLAIDHNDGACSGKPDETRDANYFVADNKGMTTALSSFSTFINNPDFTSSKTVAILPRGFGFGWGRLGKQPFWIPGNGDEEHNLLQVAYNLDHRETFIGSGKKYQKGLGDVTRGSAAPSLVPSPLQSDSGFVSWETYTIFKDNDTIRDYHFSEIVSGLGGNEVGVIQPSFSILPKKDESSVIYGECLGYSPPSREFVIENIPYEYAIPMLTGWELYSRTCKSDQKVKEIGIRIDEMRYEKSPGIPGTLRYKLSSTLWSDWGGGDRHKVTVLGLKPVPVGGTPIRR